MKRKIDVSDIRINDDLSELKNFTCKVEGKPVEYEVMRFCAILKIKDKDKVIEWPHERITHLRSFFDDITYHVKEHALYIMHNMQYSKMCGLSNKDMGRLLTEALKQHLDMADITIIEQRLPLEEVRYKLKK